jgi:hypothetical protein
MNRVTGIYTAEFKDTTTCQKICTFLATVGSSAFSEVTEKLPSSEFKSIEEGDYKTPESVEKVKEFFKREYSASDLTDKEAYILINAGVLVDEEAPHNITCTVADVELDNLKTISKYLKLAGCKKAKLVEINDDFNEIEF